MEKNKNGRELLDKYLEGKANPQERAILESWYLAYSKQNSDIEVPTQLAQKDMEVLGEFLNGYTTISMPDKPVMVVSLWKRIYIVAASLVFIATGTWIFNTYLDKDQYKVVNDVNPGKQGAMLTLANGKRIKIDASGIGSLAKEDGVTIVKSANGELTYLLEETVNGASDKRNTLSTFNGETFKIRLPDGSVIWLNAASSLTFPVSFQNAVNRRVELKGEAYFEIAKDKKKPFIVLSNNQIVEVLGTHFNINSYDDDKIDRITLIEGSVKLSSRLSKGKEYILKPRQQAIIEAGNVTLATIDVAEVDAWRQGLFMFNDEELESILLKISRWYNIDIIYQDENLKKISFWGIVTKHDKLSTVLKMLEKTKTVKFEIRENQLLVKKVNKP